MIETPDQPAGAEGGMRSPTWEEVLLAPDLDPHADERARHLARARIEADRVDRPAPRGTSPGQVPLLAPAPLRSCSRCATSRHSHAPTCPCGGSWL